MKNSLGRTTEEWQVDLGQAIKQLRLSQDIDQQSLATRSNISVRSLGNLENGVGSSLNTLIKVIRALDREDWLEALLIDNSHPSPLERLRMSQNLPKRPQRASRRRK